MRNGRSDDCDGFDVAFCRFDRLLDCLGYFGCLTGADTYAAFLVYSSVFLVIKSQ